MKRTELTHPVTGDTVVLSPETGRIVETIKADDEVRSLLLEHDEDTEPPLTQEELVEIRWTLFGKCPVCHENVKGYNSGPFNAKHYRYLQDKGIDVLTGHKQTCSEKWRKA